MVADSLNKQREESKQLVAISSMGEAEKSRWEKLIPKMLPSELLKLRRNILEQLVVEAQLETINEIRKGNKEIPDDEKGLIKFVLGKILAKVDQVEERTRVVISG